MTKINGYGDKLTVNGIAIGDLTPSEHEKNACMVVVFWALYCMPGRAPACLRTPESRATRRYAARALGPSTQSITTLPNGTRPREQLRLF